MPQIPLFDARVKFSGFPLPPTGQPLTRASAGAPTGALSVLARLRSKGDRGAMLTLHWLGSAARPGAQRAPERADAARRLAWAARFVEERGYARKRSRGRATRATPARSTQQAAAPTEPESATDGRRVSADRRGRSALREDHPGLHPGGGTGRTDQGPALPGGRGTDPRAR